MRYDAFMRYHGIYPKTGKAMPKQYARPFSEIQLLPERLEWPLHQKQPLRIFVDSMSDLFHSQIPEDYIRRVFAVMEQAHWHTFQLLTKRVGRLRRLAPVLSWAPNIWIGTSVEQDLVVARADALRTVPAKVRFLSCEPLLGPLPSLNLDGIHWLITGGESGPHARPCDPNWLRDLRDRCIDRNIAFFHKQNGGRTSKAGGRELDGHIWDQMPIVEKQVEQKRERRM
jgi:protein gp37